MRGSTEAPEADLGATRTTDLWQRAWEADAGVGYRFGTHRAVSPEETLRRITPLARRTGLTRLANITDLDWIGLPVHQAIFPNGRLYSVAQGKGLTHPEAQVSALMEGLEQFHVVDIPLPTVTETVGAMRRQLAYDPYALPLDASALLSDTTAIEWLPATDLTDGSATWVPRELCDLDSRVEERLHLPLFLTTSNGVAAGNTLPEALVHALCEVVERDAVWRAAQAKNLGERVVAPETVTAPLARRVLDSFERGRLMTMIADSSGPTGLPCYEAWLDHEDGPIVAWGSGCHPDRATALLRALTEAAQARLTYISGARDDLDRLHYRATDAGPILRQHLPPRGYGRHFEDMPNPRARDLAAELRDLAAELRDLVRRVRAVTGMAPVALDLTRPELDIPVVFVVAPGLKVSVH